MADKNGMADKNLRNVAKELAENPANAHQAQQWRQDANDRRHQDALNHDKTGDQANPKSV